MKIVIAGAGEVGFHLAKLLSKQEQDIVLIDTNSDVLEYAQSHLDLIALKGDSTFIETLQKANVGKADLVIAVTSSEEANIITAVLGKKMGALKTVVRIRSDQYLSQSVQQDFRQIGIDSLFSPRQLAATEICRLINEASLNDIHEFEQGKLSLTGLVLGDNSPLVNKSLAETANLNPLNNFMAIAIQREKETIIPRGGTVFKSHDHVYFIATREGIPEIIKLSGKEKKHIRNIMILGGGSIGVLTASLLENEYNVKLVERDKVKCYEIAEHLNKTLIINGNGTDVDLLEEEGLADMDAFIALTSNSEINIISSLVAKNHGVHKTIASVENMDYIHLARKIGVDTLVNKRLIAAHHIFMYLRKGKVKAITGLPGVEAEIIEYEVKADSKITRATIRNLGFPKNALIGGVVRRDVQHIPTGDFKIVPKDKVIVFTLPEAISKVENFFC